MISADDPDEDALDPLLRARENLSQSAHAARLEAKSKSKLVKQCEAITHRRHALRAVGVQLAGAHERVKASAAQARESLSRSFDALREELDARELALMAEIQEAEADRMADLDGEVVRYQQSLTELDRMIGILQLAPDIGASKVEHSRSRSSAHGDGSQALVQLEAASEAACWPSSISTDLSLRLSLQMEDTTAAVKQIQFAEHQHSAAAAAAVVHEWGKSDREWAKGLTKDQDWDFGAPLNEGKHPRFIATSDSSSAQRFEKNEPKKPDCSDVVLTKGASSIISSLPHPRMDPTMVERMVKGMSAFEKVPQSLARSSSVPD